MKNAYDWLSRGEDSVLKNIPAAMISSGYDQGGLRGQNALRVVGNFLKVQFMNEPVIAVKRFTGTYFNENGDLVHEEVKKELRIFL